MSAFEVGFDDAVDARVGLFFWSFRAQSLALLVLLAVIFGELSRVFLSIVEYLGLSFQRAQIVFDACGKRGVNLGNRHGSFFRAVFFSQPNSGGVKSRFDGVVFLISPFEAGGGDNQIDRGVWMSAGELG